MKCRCGKDFCYKCGGIHLNCECVRIRREEQVRWLENVRRRRLAAVRKAAETRRKTIALKKAQQELEIKLGKPNKSEERALRAKVREANKN